MSINDKINEQVSNNKVMLYMKGTPQFPQCGFSGKAVQILQACGTEFGSADVLSDPEIRQGIKDFSNWPTIPQLYVNGQFIGGCDIMIEMFENGELQKVISGS